MQKAEKTETKIYKKQIADNDTGTFVHVPTYLHFVAGAYSFTKKLKNDIYTNVPIVKFMSDTRILKNWIGIDRDSYDERVYTTVLSGIIQGVLDYLFKEESSGARLCHAVHQMEMVKEKPVENNDAQDNNKRTQSQRPDVGVLVGFEEHGKNKLKTLMTLEHNKEGPFTNFEPQSMVYSADAMSVSKRSVLDVQSYGTIIEQMKFKVFGYVPITWKSSPTVQSDHKTHYRSFLHEGQGLDGLLRIMNGLITCLPFYLEEGDWEHNGIPLSSVTAYYPKEKKVYKSFDYRNQRRVESSRRKSQVNLYRNHFDDNAELVVEEDGIEILALPYLETNYLAPVTVENMKKIIDVLRNMHYNGYVHGDIRLFNLLPCHGKIIDFDFTRRIDNGGETPVPKYAATLLPITDGKRAEEVENRIQQGSVGDLEMSQDHDIESMKNVLVLFEGIDGNILSSCDSLDSIYDYLNALKETELTPGERIRDFYPSSVAESNDDVPRNICVGTGSESKSELRKTF